MNSRQFQRHYIFISFLRRKFYIHYLFPIFSSRYQIWQIHIRIRPCHQINMMVSYQIFFDPFGHTTQHAH